MSLETFEPALVVACGHVAFETLAEYPSELVPGLMKIAHPAYVKRDKTGKLYGEYVYDLGLVIEEAHARKLKLKEEFLKDKHVRDLKQTYGVETLSDGTVRRATSKT